MDGGDIARFRIFAACGGPANGIIIARLYTISPVRGPEPSNRSVTMDALSHDSVAASDHSHGEFRFSVAPATYTFGVSDWRCTGTATVQPAKTTTVKVVCFTFVHGAAPGRVIGHFSSSWSKR